MREIVDHFQLEISSVTKVMLNKGTPKNAELSFIHYQRSLFVQVGLEIRYKININPFVPSSTFLYLLKTSEKLIWLSDIFKGVGKGTLGPNGLKGILL